MKATKKQVCIIGLGNFGKELARTLSDNCEVLALDNDETEVDAIADFVQSALVMDAKDETALRSVITPDFDEAVVCIGGNLESSILCTLHLHKIGVKSIRVKADNDDHATILKNVGATEVIFPERETAHRMAAKIKNPNIVDFIPFSDDFQVLEIAPPLHFEGYTLAELDLRKKTGILIIAVRKSKETKYTTFPGPAYKVKKDDVFLAIGHQDGAAKLEDVYPKK